MGDVCKTTSFSSQTSPLTVGTLRSLQANIAPELLRGVSLHECLSGWGKHWSAGGMFQTKQDDASQAYGLSRQTQRFDNFLSHDWNTSRWLKLATLLVVFNSRAAALATLVVSVLVGMLRAAGVLPDEPWTVVIGHVTFLLFFSFWQRMRAILRKPRMVFLDKLCIAQHDDTLKEQGILGLAAFLDHSEKLTILWSPRYFQRLWCVYEISTFLRSRDKWKPIEIMPVKLALLLCVNAGNWFIMAAAYHSIASSTGGEPSVKRTLVVGGACLCLAACMVPWTYYVGIGMMEDLHKLPQQLADFRIQDAESTCCAHQHVHPQIEQAIPCDRKLVFDTLRQWFGDAEESCGGEQHLDNFNRLVRKRLAPVVLKSVGGDNLPIGYTVYMAASANMPFLASFIPLLAKGPPVDYTAGDSLVWALRIFISWAFTSLLAVLTTRLNLFLCRHGFRMVQSRHSRICRALLLSQAAVLFVTILWAGYRVPIRRVDSKSWVPILPFLLTLGVTVAIFWQGRRVVKHQEVPPERGEGRAALEPESEKVPPELVGDESMMTARF